MFRGAIAVGVIALVIAVANSWFFLLPIGPDYGGEYSEGLVGAPKYLNPILSPANDVDSDITPLIFCSLLRRGSGELLPDLAESYTVSDDQKTYALTLRSDARWHDGEPVTVADVLFTFDLIKDPDVGSPLAKTFSGVTVDQTGDRQVTFTLKEPFAPFLGTLTFGVLPQHYWQEIAPSSVRLADLNLKPIGCGPWKFDSLKKDRQGGVKSVTLAAFHEYYNQRPYLDRITFKFYPTLQAMGDALVHRNVLGASYLPREVRSLLGIHADNHAWQIQTLQLPQYTAVFFNQNRNAILKERPVRAALTAAVDRQRIVRQVFAGEASVVDGPVLAGTIGAPSNQPVTGTFSLEQAGQLLDDAGWKAITPNEVIAWQKSQEPAAAEGEEVVVKTDPERLEALGTQEYFRRKGNTLLSVNLTVVNTPDAVAVAQLIKENWEAVGVQTVVTVVPPETVRREVIRSRAYDALLYSEIVGLDADPYPFWHSSQNGENGLNLALVSDKRVDRAIELARQTTDVAARAEQYEKFQAALADDIPAIFLYRPSYPYVVRSSIKGLSIATIAVPADRLADSVARYINAQRSFDWHALW